jgi:hypothetical protein
MLNMTENMCLVMDHFGNDEKEDEDLKFNDGYLTQEALTEPRTSEEVKKEIKQTSIMVFPQQVKLTIGVFETATKTLSEFPKGILEKEYDSESKQLQMINEKVQKTHWKLQI